jgi:hypothetical protein
MNTSNLILILLQNKNLSSKSKFFSIIEIVSSWLIEKYFFVSQEKAEQQITSEILYLFEKYEKSKQATQAWITTRLNLLKKNLLQHKTIVPRSTFEVGIDFLENTSFSDLPQSPETLEPEHKTTGWSKKTYSRFEKFVLRNRKRKNKKHKIQELSLL